MNSQQTERWLIETIDEGGYSFKELWEYVNKNGISSDEFKCILKSMLEKDVISFYISNNHVNYEVIPKKQAYIKVEHIYRIIENESLVGSEHYIEASGDWRVKLP